MIDFNSSNYLSVYNNSSFINFVQEGIEKYGYNFGGSRLSNICPELYNEAENYFIDFLSAEGALLTSSGTLSGILIAKYIKSQASYLVFESGDIHPCLRINNEKSIIFNDVHELKNLLCRHDKDIKKFIIVNSINPLNVNSLDYDFLKDISSFNNIILIVDDSHALGVLGKNGTGITSLLNDFNFQYIVSASLAKAFGIRGGVIAGDNEIIANIRNSAVWGGASPPAPFYIYTFMRANDIYISELNKLRKNMEFFIREINFPDKLLFQKDFPVFIFKEKIDENELLHNQIRISSFSYPTKNDPLKQRIVLNSGHSFSEIEKLLDVMNRHF
jgi:7-keto-8-aminopelargonate synthetase-like enzyme